MDMRKLLSALAAALVVGPVLAAAVLSARGLVTSVAAVPLTLARRPFAARPTDYSADMVVLQGNQVMQTMRLYVSGQRSRVEGMRAGPLGPIVTIARRDKGVLWTLYLDRKQYVEKPMAATGQPDLSNLDLSSLQTENLGKENVLGYACTKMRVNLGALPNGRPMTSTVWIADSLDLPIRLEAMAIVQENRNLKIGPQPPSLFEIPAGFVKTGAPGMPAGMMPPTAAGVAAQRPPYGGKDAQAVAGSQSRAGAGGGGTGGPAGVATRVEADALRVIRCTSGEVMPRKLAEDGYANPGEFTGDLSLQWHDATGPGAVLELALPVEKKGRYAVSVRVAKYRTYAIHQFLFNGVPLGKPVDMFGNPGQDIVTAFTVYLGEMDLVAGVNRLGIRIVGSNAETIMANHGAGLDWVSLEPVRVDGGTGIVPAG
jgi:hypothetical protein